MTRPRPGSIVALLVWIWSASSAYGQIIDPAPIYGSNEPAVEAKDGKVLHAFRINAPPQIDGRLDEEVWERAERAEHFVQWEPDNMSPLSERTVMQVAYDDRYLYVAVRCYDRTPDAIAAGLGRRDELPSSDVLSVGFDARHDHLTGYVFQVNPSSVQGDFFFFDDDRADRDYDGVWEVRAAIGDEGWTAEFRIPFSQVRFEATPSARTVWGFSARRNIFRRGETGEWTGRPRGERGEVSRWGHLVFDSALEPPRRVEVIPYSVGRAERLSGTASTDLTGAAGLDARIGIGSASTISATINPDFGQVEQDPAVLNLSVFETFFPEKRPFFTEDSRTFVPGNTGLFQLFHSRRIGRRPDRFAAPSSETVVDRPDQTSILGAAKFTGKASGWTYGALSALTGREHAAIASGPPFLLEPLTSYHVARVQRDVFQGSSNIGAIATAAVREGADDAVTGGVDYNIRWDRNRATWDGLWAVTRAPGAGGVKTGLGGVMNFGFSRKYVNAGATFDHLDRDFRVNDLGFQRNRVNRTLAGGRFVVEQPDPWKAFRRISNTLSVSRAWNQEGLVFSNTITNGVNLQFRSFWTVDVGALRELEVLDDLDTRGGPPIVKPAAVFGYANIGSDSRKPWRVFFAGNVGSIDEGGRSAFAKVDVTVKPSGQLQMSFSLRYDVGTDVAQWILNCDVTGDGIIDHVYGTLARDVVDVTMRATYAINRDLTFQIYLQPFVAVGAFSDIRRLARPRSFDFEAVTLPTSPDFNRKSLRGNAVLRWEYVRGSTLYLVWNPSTSDTTRPGRFSPFRDLADAFGADGSHVVMVKASYWFSR